MTDKDKDRLVERLLRAKKFVASWPYKVLDKIWSLPTFFLLVVWGAWRFTAMYPTEAAALLVGAFSLGHRFGVWVCAKVEQALKEAGFTGTKADSVWAVVNYYEGSPQIRCIHATEKEAKACRVVQANERRMANGRGPVTTDKKYEDSDGDIQVSGRELFAVEEHMVQTSVCEDDEPPSALAVGPATTV